MVTETIWFSRVWYHRGLRYLHNSGRDHCRAEHSKRSAWYNRLEASKNGGVSQTLGSQSLYMTGAVAACFDGYGDGHYSRTHRQHHVQNLELNLCYTLKKSLLCVRLSRYSMRAADVASTARMMSLGRWLFVACFSSVKNHNVSGPRLFPSVTTHAKKIPLLP